MKHPNQFGRIALAVVAFMVAGSAIAAQAEGSLEEIVVTAQKREQRLQDVGVSVTALSADTARELGVIDTKSIAKIAPGVIFDSTAGGAVNANLTIRGVSQSDFSSNQESPNSIYIDDVYVSSSSAASFPLYDMERIEVLRGPQGTLFGRASSGGLVNFLTKRPTKQFDAYGEIGYSSFGHKYVEGAVGGPFTGSVRGRISARWEDSDGWYKNSLPGGKNAFQEKYQGVRAQLEADLSEALTARISFTYDKTPEERAGVYKAVPAYYVGGQPTLLPANVDAYGSGAGNDFPGFRDPKLTGPTGSFNNVGHFGNEKVSPTLYLDWKLGASTLTAITNYTHFKFDYNEDCDGGPVNYCNFPITQDLKQFSEEVRANGTSGNTTWTTGVYFLSTDQDASAAFSFPSLSGTDFAFSDANPVKQKLTSYAAFGQIEYKFTPTLTSTVGVRYTHDKKTYDSKVFFDELGNGYSGGTGSTIFVPPLLVYDFSPATVGNAATETEGMWSGKVQIDFRPVEHSLFYVSASRGVKGPGFNTNVSGNLTNLDTPFRSEHLMAYEAGAKLEFLDKRVRLNSSVYYYDYKGFQGFAFNGLQGVVGNYDGNFRGGELEFVAIPAEDWLVSTSASYMSTTLKGIPTAYNGVRDQESILAPKWTTNGSVRKAFPIGNDKVALTWSFDYVADRYASVDNNLGTFVPASFVHNIRATYEKRASGLEFAVFVDNLSNKDRMNFSFDLITSTGSLIQSYAKPRIYGASIRKTF
jgi:iron complex outermembrane receptor protein